MAVHTKITLQALNKLFEENNLSVSVAALENIESGISNSNYRVIANDGRRYILTIHESPNTAPERAIEFSQRLRSAGVPTIECVANDKGKFVLSYEGKPVTLMHEISGRSLSQEDIITTDQCRILGEQIAAFHAVTIQKPDPAILNPFQPKALPVRTYTIQNLRSCRNSLKRMSEAVVLQKHLTRCAALNTRQGNDYFTQNEVQSLSELLKTPLIENVLEKALGYQEMWNEAARKLPTAICHGDIWPDNTMWKGDEFNGLIDLWTARRDFVMYDLAGALLAWTTEFEPNKQWQFNAEKYTAMIEGYIKGRAERNAPITTDEIKFLPKMMEANCVQYLAFRCKRLLEENAVNVYKNPLNPLAYIGRMQALSAIPELDIDSLTFPRDFRQLVANTQNSKDGNLPAL